MQNYLRVVLLFVFWSIAFSGLAAASAPMTPYTVSEIKLFTLHERQVVAVALDDRISGKGIDEVLGYRLNPSISEQRTGDRLAVTLSNVVWL